MLKYKTEFGQTK